MSDSVQEANASRKLKELLSLKPRDVEECIDELERELLVRIRCYDRWVDDGRISRTDARDRMQRMASAWVHLRLLQSAGTGQAPVPGPTENASVEKPF